MLCALERDRPDFVFLAGCGEAYTNSPQSGCFRNAVGANCVRPRETTGLPYGYSIKFGRDIVSSADLCYNGISEKPPSERERWICATLGYGLCPYDLVGQRRNRRDIMR